MEHQQAMLEIVSLLLAHGVNSDELYTPVSNNSTSHLCTMYFLLGEQWYLDLAPCAEEQFLSQGDAHSPHQYRYKPRRLLHQAAIWNNAAIADLLLLYEADQNARDFNVSHGLGRLTCCHAMSSVICTRSPLCVILACRLCIVSHCCVAAVSWLLHGRCMAATWSRRT